MDILTQSATLLNQFGYETEFLDMLNQRVLYFEDDSLLGLVWVDDVGTIIAKWQEVQDQFVRTNAAKLRQSLTKTWNLYMVCLASERCSAEQQMAFATIQENFRGARKIIQSGITGESQLVRALYPLLPIQNLVSLDAENPVGRIRERLKQLPMNAVDALVSNDLESDNALRTFLDAHEITAN
jgi:hypothetical protein